MVLGHDEIWWSAVAAIGQVLGAIATFAAVSVSLWVVSTDRSLRGQGYAKILASFAGDGSPGICHLGFRVENTGIRDLLVQSISWRTGWWKWGPDWAKFKYEVRDAELKLKQLKLWLERDENIEKAKEVGGTAESVTSAYYIYEHAKKLEAELKKLANR